MVVLLDVLGIVFVLSPHPLSDVDTDREHDCRIYSQLRMVGRRHASANCPWSGVTVLNTAYGALAALLERKFDFYQIGTLAVGNVASLIVGTGRNVCPIDDRMMLTVELVPAADDSADCQAQLLTLSHLVRFVDSYGMQLVQ